MCKSFHAHLKGNTSPFHNFTLSRDHVNHFSLHEIVGNNKCFLSHLCGALGITHQSLLVCHVHHCANSTPGYVQLPITRPFPRPGWESEQWQYIPIPPKPLGPKVFWLEKNSGASNSSDWLKECGVHQLNTSSIRM